jgi:hypothetical protein
MPGVWNVDISQGYSFVLTVTGKEASFEGGSYGTWSNIQVDSEKATFSATWHSGKHHGSSRLGLTKVEQPCHIGFLHAHIRGYIYICIYIHTLHP